MIARLFLAFLLLIVPQVAQAGPPFLTDDPVPTDTHHWEIYGPFIEGEGKGADFAGSTGVELNYGAATDLQITLGLPLAFAHDDSGWQSGVGDVAISAKYRFYHDEGAGISIAAFPGITVPTASHGLGNRTMTALLPVWVEKDAGGWSVFGGGGYAIHPGAGNCDYWTGGVAITRQVDTHLLLGLETDRQGADTIGGRASTSLGLGAIYQLPAPFRLLASGGPTFADAGGAAGFHAYVALGTDF